MILSTSHAQTAKATSTEELHQQADIWREEGKSLQAIDLYNQAIVRYQEEHNYSKILGAMTGRLLSWKHLFYKTEDAVYAIFVQKEAEAMQAIATDHHLLDKMHLIHYLKGTSALLLKDYALAESEFSQAVHLFPQEDAEKGDWIAHWGEAIYLNGNKDEGKKVILKGVLQIQKNAAQIDTFQYNVWVSGAYLKLAKLLQTDQPQDSQFFLEQAKKIIDGDPRLVIRKQQLEAYLKTFKHSY